jgi:hypothetical protein
MPHASSDVVASRARAELSSVAANDFVPLVRLKMPDALREEACSDEVEQACRDEEKVLDGRDVAPPGVRLAVLRDIECKGVGAHL